jgi:hypothetical protein
MEVITLSSIAVVVEMRNLWPFIQNRDDRFLALIGYDGQLDLALLNVEHLVGDITLLEHVLIFKEIQYRLSLSDFGEKHFRIESILGRHDENPFSTFRRMGVHPSPVPEKPSQGLRDLQVLIPFLSGAERPAIEQHGSPQPDKLSLGVEPVVGWLIEQKGNPEHGGHLSSPGGGRRWVPSCHVEFQIQWSILLALRKLTDDLPSR